LESFLYHLEMDGRSCSLGHFLRGSGVSGRRVDQLEMTDGLAIVIVLVETRIVAIWIRLLNQ
jgi:hypothetical protein